MILRDHFRPPVADAHRWESFLSNWATRIADGLNEKMPAEFLAEEEVEYPDTYEVRVTNRGRSVVGVVAVVSPTNKRLPGGGTEFSAKMAHFLTRGISVVLVDVVTTCRGNLHNETLRLLPAERPSFLPEDTHLYAVAYRPVARGERTEIDIWPHRLELGSDLPTLPLRLTGDTFVPVELGPTYTEACRRRRITPEG